VESITYKKIGAVACEDFVKIFYSLLFGTQHPIRLISRKTKDMKSLEFDSRIEIDRGEIVNDIYSVSTQYGNFLSKKNFL